MKESQKIVYIYLLKDPRDEEIRYIGKTVNIKKRIRHHITNCSKRKYHSARWLNSLKKEKLEPICEIVEECNEENWEEREIYWIKFYKKTCDLTNILEGGQHGATYGRLGKKWTEDHRINYKKSRTGIKMLNQNDKNGLRRAAIIKYKESIRKEVNQYDLEGNFIKTWDCSTSAEVSINGKKGSFINKVCKNKNSAYGFQWRFLEEVKNNNNINRFIKKTPSKKIIRIDKNGDKIIYPSIAKASSINKMSRNSITNALKNKSETFGNFYWEYLKEI